MSANGDNLARFRALVRESLGLHLDDVRDDTLLPVLERRLAARRVTPSLYFDLVQDAGTLRDEARALAIELTVGETYFFRHAEQLRAFAEIALPDRVRVRGDVRRVRVLCAGCASGEEPYTLAMLAREAGLDTGPASIRAVDVNASALAKAARASYSSWALRETPSASGTRWFTSMGSEHVLDETIRAMVRFELKNLATGQDEIGTAGAYDVVFCRNVLMYFTPARMRAAVARLTTLLAPGGYLFLGHAETLRGVSSAYHLRHAHDAFYYQRKDTAALAQTEEATPAHARPPEVSWTDAIREAAERVRRVTEAASPTPDSSPPLGSPLGRGLVRALELARDERYAEALDALGPSDGRDVDALLLRAALLTQNGAAEDAALACRRVLAIDEMHAGAHYLLALCHEASGDREGATDHARMAVHLDPGFAMPRLHMGMAARRRGEHDVAKSELGRALELLHCEDPARILLFGGGFARAGLIALCRGELRACGARS